MDSPTAYRTLLSSLDRWFARGVAAAGAGVVPCRTGCTACCHGPFDISPADAALVAEGIALLPEEVRAGVAARAEAQLARYRELIEGWGPPWDVDALSEEAFDALAESMRDAPCPALGAEGGCLIYDHRPATCRITGLAMVSRDGDVLENVCPIQGEFPDYAALAPTPFDLHRFEVMAEEADLLASEAGWVTTTVAGVVGGAR
jgi:Fe-S-cluster containining protein